MSILVMAVGGVNLGAGLLGALAPDRLKAWAGQMWKSKRGYFVALVARLSLSAMLIIGSRNSRFSMVILILGIISAIMAISIIFISQEKQNRLRDWTLSRPNKTVRTESLVGLLLGAFLIYAAL